MNTVSRYLLTLGGQAACQESRHCEIMDQQYAPIAQLNKAPLFHVKQMSSLDFKVGK